LGSTKAIRSAGPCCLTSAHLRAVVWPGGSSGSSLWPLGTGGPVVTAEELVPFGLGEVAAGRHAGLGFPSCGLQEFYRPAFHRQHFARLAELNAQFQGWLQPYNTSRRNHGDFMRGRTPYTVMEAYLS